MKNTSHEAPVGFQVLTAVIMKYYKIRYGRLESSEGAYCFHLQGLRLS